MSNFAKGTRAKGVCDRCGFTYKLHELMYQWIDGFKSSLRVCEECLDIDHEQLRTESADTNDAIALRDPRPVQNLDVERAFFGWDPLAGEIIRVSVGTVTVTTT